MDSSRRAVEAYRRSRMIDAVTSDEDKVAPVYKLEEVCNLLRTSHVSIVKEVSEYVLKRLDHKSPVVKQKTLRLIKYAVRNSGVGFRREMQRNAVSMRQLFHYKGHIDPLKGDALNKAVRDTAHEAVSALFASEDNPAPSDENIKKRIEGFGNTNFSMKTEDKKSFLSELVAFGSTSILQGLSALKSDDSLLKDDSGSYRSPNLHRSLSEETNRFDNHNTDGFHRESWGSSGGTNNLKSWNSESSEASADTRNTMARDIQSEIKTPEHKLLDSMVTFGGVRLQPTRDAIQNFLKEAAKLDPICLCLAIESKLQSHVWQVRMKAACVLEAILQKKDGEFFALVASYFSEKRDAILKCSETPQASVRLMANKVLSLLDGNQSIEGKTRGIAPNDKAREKADVQLPDLIDCVDLDSPGKEEASIEAVVQFDRSFTKSTSPHSVNDLFEDNGITKSDDHSVNANGGDPFSDVSVHTNEMTGREHANGLFSGLVVDNEQSDMKASESKNDNQLGSFDIFRDSVVDITKDSPSHGRDLNDLLADLSVKSSAAGQQPLGVDGGAFAKTMTSGLNNLQGLTGQNNVLNGLLNSPMGRTNHNGQIPQGSTQYNFTSNIIFNPAFPSQQVNYNSMSNLVAQHQLLAAMSNIQRLGSVGGNQGNVGYGNLIVGNDGGYSSALPDIFQTSGHPIQSNTRVADNSRKDDTRAFDFISDHISSVRDPKGRV